MSFLSDLDELKNWASPHLQNTRDPVLDELIQAASGWLEESTGRIYDATAYTRYFSGGEAVGHTRERIYLPTGHRPVALTAMTVTEDGVSLDVAKGYDASADVILSGADVDEQAYLIRDGGWSNSYPQNVTVVYTAGHATIPSNVKQLVNEIAWSMFKQPNSAGKASVSRSRGSTSVASALSPWAQQLLASLTVI